MMRPQTNPEPDAERPPHTPSAIEQRALDALNIDELVGFAQRLIAIPSLTGSPEEDQAQHLAAALMEQVGLTVDRWALDHEALKSHPGYSVEYDRQHGLGVAGTLGGDGTSDDVGRSLILNGHVDVVPPGDESQWTHPPFVGVVDDGYLHGRGALDMKGALCCAIAAAAAIKRAGITLRGRLTVLSVIGEEDGGLGTLAAVERGYRADGAIVLEPTDLAVVPAQAGALNFRITVPGRAAHGAVRDRGISAIEKFFPIYQAIMGLEAARNRDAHIDPLLKRYTQPFPICIGTVRGGDWASSVAGELVCEGRFGVAFDEDLAAAKRALEQTIHDAAQQDPWLRDHPPRLTWWGAQFHPARTPTDATIVQHLSAAYQQVVGQAPVVEAVPYGADMRLLVNQGGTPTVLFGPGDVAGAHCVDERISIEALRTAAQSVTLAAMRFCGVVAK